MKVSIVGSGTVGTAVGKGLAKFGHDVLFCDVRKTRVEALQEEGEHATLDNTLREITFITVPAPTKDDGTINLNILKTVLQELGKQIPGREDYPIIAVKSTLLPHLLRDELLPYLEKQAGSKAGDGFGFCYNPEFLRQKHALDDFLHPDRIVLGKCDQQAVEKLKQLYKPFDAPLYCVSLEEAAMVKYVANNFLSTKISYFNQVYMIAKEWGINPDVVSDIVSADERISDYGTIGGWPFGGKCLIKDLESFLHFAEKENNPSLLKAVKKVNEKIAESKHRREKQV